MIVAAGRGERLGGEGGPKQYRSLGAKSLLQHTVNCFVEYERIGAVQVVIHADDFELYAAAINPHDKILPPVVGGATRQASCKAGIDALEMDRFEKVLIHDAARPFVPSEVIAAVLEGTQPGTCALPATAIADTVKKANQDGGSFSRMRWSR